MKIAVVIPKYGGLGGAEGFAFETCRRLALQSDLNIHVFAHRWYGEDAGVTFHRIPFLPFPRSLRPVFFAFTAKRAVAEGRFDLVHSHDRIFGMDVFTMHGIPHSTWIREARGKRLSLFDRSLAWVEKKGVSGSIIPRLLPVSSLVKEELLRVYPFLEPLIKVLHPGVSLERFSNQDKDLCRSEIRSAHGISETDLVVLFVGMNFEIKRLDLVLEGVAEVIRRKKDKGRLKVLVVGKGDSDNYRRSATRLGIEKRVLFAGPRSDVERYYLASDIFAMPSSFDTFGLAVLEAMAAGIPAIITERVGAKDIIMQGKSGIVLSRHPDKDEMAGSIESLLDREIRISMGKEARATASDHSWDRVALEIRNVYLKAHEQTRIRPSGK
ncbi:MAG: glycosyltransferase family 1 protein [Desulfobacteraceae bacterium]|jgi:UDP-glucose:(heptosyl)LPS alpha-1,3-glucosyltransferase|nr:MAG: glycosyltransferase family 1 protein [Desulfobacteraceae bacterium]